MQLAPFERKEFSQFTEDGILLELVRRLDPPHFFVEIGAGDGSENCTRVLAERKWSGAWIDRDPQNIHRAKALPCAQWLQVICAHFDVDHVGYIAHVAPHEIGVLSIDVDGMDYWLWKALCEPYRSHFSSPNQEVLPPRLSPWIVVIEAQIQKPHDQPFVQPYEANHQWDNASQDVGASIFSLRSLGDSLGYTYLGKCPDAHSPNLFFVRSDLVGALGE